MKILLDLGHPAHAHFFRYSITELENDGYKFKIAAREREMLYYLLDKFGMDYTPIGKTKEGILNKAADMFRKDLALIKMVDDFKPDLMIATGTGSPYSAQVGKLKSIPNITFTDTEHARFINWLTLPFTDIVITPECYTKEVRTKRHIRYKGYHELAYLHPNHFQPDPDIRQKLGIDDDEKVILLKFAQWTSSHDLGVTGFDFKDDSELIAFVKEMDEHGKVMISSELPLPEELAGYDISLPFELIHDLIAACDLYIGEGATMASEAAVLGVPAIFISTLRLGYLDELEKKYRLVYSYSKRSEAVEKAVELLSKKGIGPEWKHRREKMLEDNIDVSRYTTDLIKNFPGSIEK